MASIPSFTIELEIVMHALYNNGMQSDVAFGHAADAKR
jgi:hypothetical protein